MKVKVCADLCFDFSEANLSYFFEAPLIRMSFLENSLSLIELLSYNSFFRSFIIFTPDMIWVVKLK